MKEITPKHLRCTIGACPGVFEVEGNDLIVIGKKISSALNEEIGSRVGEDEFAVRISRDFFSELQKK